MYSLDLVELQDFGKPGIRNDKVLGPCDGLNLLNKFDKPCRFVFHSGEDLCLDANSQFCSVREFTMSTYKRRHQQVLVQQSREELV